MIWQREMDLLVDGCRALLKATGEACTVLIGKDIGADSYYAVKTDAQPKVIKYLHYTDLVLLGGSMKGDNF